MKNTKKNIKKTVDHFHQGDGKLSGLFINRCHYGNCVSPEADPVFTENRPVIADNPESVMPGHFLPDQNRLYPGEFPGRINIGGDNL